MNNPLTASDTRSATWRRLESWAVIEISRLRERNDSPALTPDQTAQLRGQIYQLKQMLSLAETASDGRAEPLAVFDHTSTSSIEAAIGGHQEDRDQ